MSNGRIEVSIEEYNGMRKKIRDLESALNSVSKDAATNKEIVEQAKVLVADLLEETFVERVFRWKSIIEPLNTLLNGTVQETSEE